MISISQGNSITLLYIASDLFLCVKKSFTFFEMQIHCAFTSFEIIYGLLHFSLAVFYTWAVSTKGWAGISHLNKFLLVGTETNLVEKTPSGPAIGAIGLGLETVPIYISWHFIKNY